MTARYAIYFAPDRASPWRRFGVHWLGRDEHDSADLPQPQLTHIAGDELNRITAQPRRYGFHATLKAPFPLAVGCEESHLLTRLARLASSIKPVPLGPMRVATLGDFVALVPQNPSEEVERLAATCVTDLDDLRAPMRDDERTRRRVERLDARENELMERYGYPYVLERFRLHLTLTGPVDAQTAQRVTQAVSPVVTRLNEEAPLWLDRLCLYVERSPGAPFDRIIDLKLPA
jgi:putative phosphonate metabolism protein